MKLLVDSPNSKKIEVLLNFSFCIQILTLGERYSQWQNTAEKTLLNLNKKKNFNIYFLCITSIYVCEGEIQSKLFQTHAPIFQFFVCQVILMFCTLFYKSHDLTVTYL